MGRLGILETSFLLCFVFDSLLKTVDATLHLHDAMLTRVLKASMSFSILRPLVEF